MHSPSEIVETIKSVCKERNITVKSLEIACGLSNGQIGKWGKRNNIYPPHDKLAMIAEILEVHVNYLTGEEDKKEKPPAEGGEQYDEVDRKLMELVHSDNRKLKEAMLAHLEYLKSLNGGD